LAPPLRDPLHIRNRVSAYFFVQLADPPSPRRTLRPVNYYYYCRHRLVVDEISPSWPTLPRLNERDDERYVEFYWKDNCLYKIRHKQRLIVQSSEPPARLAEQDPVAESGEPAPASNDLDYWKYVLDHPGAHSKTIQNILLDRRAEASSLLQSSKPASAYLHDPQISRRLSILDGLGADSDISIIRTIAMVLGGVVGTEDDTDMIARWAQFIC
jgi:hypothetical protein